ncbi:hypothetical protein K7J14_08450 [Treponema zuelzerae]|uniref:Uncharacterized protein n=1 Tax=Teretinema zuelzerae TaxID=156 RepID=A0AAE3EI98_9SPIR|nr:hypothetical protein [Teretinema zuelzerae]MCD1654735.1 hypothetical protein [Teretinema zuelzerae]
MGTIEHTQEPWRVEEIGDRRNFLTIAKENESILTVVEECGHGFGAFYKPDDALRVVACVNACRGISQEILEDPEYLIKKELDSIDEQFSMRKKSEAERDELKKALFALEEAATAVESDIDTGAPVEYGIERLRDELIRVRKVLKILPEEEAIESKR